MRAKTLSETPPPVIKKTCFSPSNPYNLAFALASPPPKITFTPRWAISLNLINISFVPSVYPPSIQPIVPLTSTLSPGFKTRLIQKGVPIQKLTVIPNWCHEEALSQQEPSGAGLIKQDGEFIVLFAGNIGPGQALDCVLDAALILRNRSAKVRFVLLRTLRNRSRKIVTKLPEFWVFCSLTKVKLRSMTFSKNRPYESETFIGNSKRMRPITA